MTATQYLISYTHIYTFSHVLLRMCSFSPRKDGNGSLYFYSINIPIKWNQRNKQACYLIKWDTGTWKPLARQKTGKELLSTMAVR